MQPAWISFIVIPLSSGIVGYITNYIAIKMLFRPYKKKWYSFGWQGIIPKNREKLANKIGLMVSKELISYESVRTAIFNEKFQIILEKTIHDKVKSLISEDLGALEDLLAILGFDSKKVAHKVIDYIVCNEELLNTINSNINILINEGLKKLLTKRLSEYPAFLEHIEKALNEIFSKYIITDELIDKVSSNIDDIVLSGKSLLELIKIDTDEILANIASNITDKLIASLYDVLQKEEIKSKIAERIKDFKNNYFKNGFFNKLKLTAINIILTDETIDEIIEKEFPRIVNAINENPELKEKINTSLTEYINRTLKKPIYEHIEKIGFDKFYEYRAKTNHRLKAYIHSENFNLKITHFVSASLERIGEKKIGELLEAIMKTDNADNANNITIDIIPFIKNGDNKSHLEGLIYNIFHSITLNGLYDNIADKTLEKIVINIKDTINNIIDKNLVDALNAIDISKIITNKINSLPTEGVENLLFSFMKDELAWINILGFILGFIIGIFEVIILVW